MWLTKLFFVKKKEIFFYLYTQYLFRFSRNHVSPFFQQKSALRQWPIKKM